jgi:hypothetical protein
MLLSNWSINLFFHIYSEKPFHNTANTHSEYACKKLYAVSVNVVPENV